MSKLNSLDSFFGFVEGFEDEDLQRRIFGRCLNDSSLTKHFFCPHCGRKVFIRSGESGVFELVKHFVPDLDGRDSVILTDVVPHDCGIDDLFEDNLPF